MRAIVLANIACERLTRQIGEIKLSTSPITVDKDKLQSTSHVKYTLDIYLKVIIFGACHEI